MTEYPFFKAGQSHWGIKGEDDKTNHVRWEVDNYLTTSPSQYHTHHQVWVR